MEPDNSKQIKAQGSSKRYLNASQQIDNFKFDKAHTPLNDVIKPFEEI